MMQVHTEKAVVPSSEATITFRYVLYPPGRKPSCRSTGPGRATGWCRSPVPHESDPVRRSGGRSEACLSPAACGRGQRIGGASVQNQALRHFGRRESGVEMVTVVRDAAEPHGPGAGDRDRSVRFLCDEKEQPLPGRYITDHQVRLYMDSRKEHSPAVAAAQAAFSRATGHRYESNPRPPSQKNKPRDRRPDPAAGIFDQEVVPIAEGVSWAAPGTRTREWWSRRAVFEGR